MFVFIVFCSLHSFPADDLLGVGAWLGFIFSCSSGFCGERWRPPAERSWCRRPSCWLAARGDPLSIMCALILIPRPFSLSLVSSRFCCFENVDCFASSLCLFLLFVVFFSFVSYFFLFFSTSCSFSYVLDVLDLFLGFICLLCILLHSFFLFLFLRPFYLSSRPISTYLCLPTSF